MRFATEAPAPVTSGKGMRWDSVPKMRLEQCTLCHGSFFNGTDSIANTGYSLGA